MGDESDPKGKSAGTTLMWLMVGLAPILILLLAVSGNGLSQGDLMSLLVLCVVCNLIGGFGCARNVKDWVARIALGLVLAGCFFVLSVIVAVFEACSHMQM